MKIKVGDCLKIRNKWFVVTDVKIFCGSNLVYYQGEFENDYLYLPEHEFKIQKVISLDEGKNLPLLAKMFEEILSGKVCNSVSEKLKGLMRDYGN